LKQCWTHPSVKTTNATVRVQGFKGIRWKKRNTTAARVSKKEKKQQRKSNKGVVDRRGSSWITMDLVSNLLVVPPLRY
jgi:hypothetical protein